MRRAERKIEDEQQIGELLKECKVCRIGLNDNGRVYIVPLNFGYCYEEGKLTLYFHCAKEGRKLDIIKENPLAGFEMDCRHDLVTGKLACQHSYHYASMIGNGEVHIITDKEEKNKALGLLMHHMTGKQFEEFDVNPKLEQAVTVIKLEATEFSCKQYLP